MRNYEKYADEIRGYKDSDFCGDFIIPYILESKEQCEDIDCRACQMLQTIWLLEEYEEPKEPEVDWSKVEVDTPILVRDYEDQEWERRHFAKYEYGTVYAWRGGETSWTSGWHMTRWKYAKLAESEKGGAE